MVYGLRNLRYEYRLKRLNLFSLDFRGRRGDLIEAFKIINGYEKMDKAILFTESCYKQLRGHSCKLYQKPVRTQLRQKIVSQRIVSKWNELSEVVVKSTSIKMFKNRLDKFVGHNVGIKNC